MGKMTCCLRGRLDREDVGKNKWARVKQETATPVAEHFEFETPLLALPLEAKLASTPRSLIGRFVRCYLTVASRQPATMDEVDLPRSSDTIA